MPTIQEISDEFTVSLAKLRRMERRGILVYEPDEGEDSEIEAIRKSWRRNRVLNAMQLVRLIESPDLLRSLPPAVAKGAQGQIEALGDVVPAPLEISAAISGVASEDPACVLDVLQWAKETLPAHDVSHHYLAVRLLLGAKEFFRESEYRRMRRVMLVLRRQDDFAGWWHTEAIGKRNVTYYHQPKGFDL
jgi:hypothetical protein